MDTTLPATAVLQILYGHSIESLAPIKDLTWKSWDDINAVAEIINDALGTITAYKNALKPIIHENGYACGLFIALECQITSNLRCALSVAQDIRDSPNQIDACSRNACVRDLLRSALAQLDVIGVFAGHALRELNLA